MGDGTFSIRRYTPADKEAWNAFVKKSKNGTFLFDRNYMDYHKSRFEDCSLMVCRKGALWALLPANRDGDRFCSHQGLTYGGFVTDTVATAGDMVTVLTLLNGLLREHGFRQVVYKAVPWIYHRVPAEEDIYAIYKVCGVHLAARDISSAIVMSRRLKWHHSRKCGVNRCRKDGVTVQRSDDFEGFWQVLNGNLMTNYGVRAVHTLDEILLLKSRFPDNILLYTAVRGGEVLGGTVLYLTPQVVHAQYISASPEGKRLRVIDAIYDVILNHDFVNAPYFDFGKSTEGDGHVLNESLIFQKEGLGGRGVCYDRYEWSL